jgi:N-acetylmuramoyl-L-alanine amidase
MIKVCIDAGHGGTDRFNTGKAGYVEADGMLALSYHLKRELLQTGYFDVAMTRTRDEYMSLTERAQITAGSKCDVLLSQHSNAGGGYGAEVFYSLRQPQNKDFAYKLSGDRKYLGTMSTQFSIKLYSIIRTLMCSLLKTCFMII